MKKIATITCAAALALAACAPTSNAPEPTAADPFIGNRLVAENDTVFLFDADGTVGGSIRGEAIVGTYTANAQEICSTYTKPDFLAGREYCSVPEFDGETVLFNRRDGSRSQPYTLEN